MVSKWLTILIIYKYVCCLNSQNDRWDELASTASTFKETNGKAKIARSKHTKSYMTNPSILTKEITESIFPDVTYPTSVLDAREPFYFRTSGYDDVLTPFSDDVKMSYKALKADKGKQSTLSNYVPVKPVEEAKVLKSKLIGIEENFLISNDSNIASNVNSNYNDEQNEQNVTLVESDNNLNINCREKAFTIITGAKDDSKSKDNSEILLEKPLTSSKLSSENLREAKINAGDFNSSKEMDMQKSNINYTNVSVESLILKLPSENKLDPSYSKEIDITDEAKSIFNYSQPHIKNNYQLIKENNPEEMNDYNEYRNIGESDLEFSRRLFRTKIMFHYILKSLENFQDIKSSEFECIKQYLDTFNDTVNSAEINEALNTIPIYVSKTKDTVMNGLSDSSFYLLPELFDNEVLLDIITKDLSAEVLEGKDVEEILNTEGIYCLPPFITELFANHLTKVEANIRLKQESKAISSNTSHDNVKDISISDYVCSCDHSHEVDKIILGEPQYTYESIEMFNDNSDESNVKSAASSLSTFDTFKCTKNPFTVLFNFPGDV